MEAETRDMMSQTLSTDVAQWSQKGKPDESQILILSLFANVDVLSLRSSLTARDAHVLSIGPDVIIASVKCEDVPMLANTEGIARIDMQGPYESLTDRDLAFDPG